MSLTKRILVCFIAVAVAITCSSPLSIKAARSLNNGDLYYITYQANINNQTMIDNGYNSSLTVGYSTARYITNGQIPTYNNFEMPDGINLGDWDYYIMTSGTTWQGEDSTDGVPASLVVYNGDFNPILYKGRPQLRDQYSAIDGYRNGTYGWDYGGLCFYHPDMKDLFDNDQIKVFHFTGGQWNDVTSTTVLYQDVSFSMNGMFIVSSNHPNFYYGKDIDLNSTKTVNNYYVQEQVVAFINDGIENSPNLMPSFQVTKDGTNYEGWDDAFGESDLELQGDTTLAFATCDCTPIKDGYNPLTNAYAEWTVDTGSFDFTFGGDQMKQASALNKWGVSFDVGIQYKIIGTNGNKQIANGGASGTIYAHIDDFNLTQDQFLNGHYEISLFDLATNGTSYSGGDAGAYLMALFMLSEEAPQVVKFGNDHLVVNGGQAVQDTVVNFLQQQANNNVPWLRGIDFNQVVNSLGGSRNDLSFELVECRYDVLMYPVNTGLGIKGQKGEAYCDLNTGVHNGRSTGAVIPPSNEDGNEIIRPDYSSGDNQNFYYPVTLPGGGSGLALQEGSPSSNANATGGTGYGGTATANVQFESGIKGLTDRFLEEEGKEDWSKSWWSVFGTFKDNPASGLYAEYFGWLPEEFMKFLLSIASVVFLVGAARFIRRG